MKEGRNNVHKERITGAVCIQPPERAQCGRISGGVVNCSMSTIEPPRSDSLISSDSVREGGGEGSRRPEKNGRRSRNGVQHVRNVAHTRPDQILIGVRSPWPDPGVRRTSVAPRDSADRPRVKDAAVRRLDGRMRLVACTPRRRLPCRHHRYSEGDNDAHTRRQRASEKKGMCENKRLTEGNRSGCCGASQCQTAHSRRTCRKR